jgi:SAM-dependent methyltransferase
MDAKAVEQKIAALYKVLVRCPGANSQTFDRTYKSEAAPFNEEPNAFMVEAVRGLKPGRALDVAMGQGRNSIYLAKTGWEVTGFDISAEGLAIAQKAAAEAGVTINTVHKGWENFDFGKERWDLIVLSYAWIPISDADLLRRMCTSLRPGGWIVFEGYLVDDPNSTGMWPGPNQLLRVFQADLRILRYEDVEAVSDWRNRGKTRIARLLAGK